MEMAVAMETVMEKERMGKRNAFLAIANGMSAGELLLLVVTENSGWYGKNLAVMGQANI
jgi:hypothetical protein